MSGGDKFIIAPPLLIESIYHFSNLRSKYLFIYLLVAIDIFLIYQIYNKKFNYKSLFSLITFFLILTPHLIWLINNDYITITYGLHRTGTGDQIY